MAAYEAAMEAKPFVERVVTIGGSAIGSPSIARVRIGTVIADVLEQFNVSLPSTVILGGPMRGQEVDPAETPILRDSMALLALKGPTKKLLGGMTPGFGFDSYTRIIPPLFGGLRKATTGLNGPEKPCIRCGYCVDVCPQNLHSIWLAEAADRGDSTEMKKLDAFRLHRLWPV